MLTVRNLNQSIMRPIVTQRFNPMRRPTATRGDLCRPIIIASSRRSANPPENHARTILTVYRNNPIANSAAVREIIRHQTITGSNSRSAESPRVNARVTVTHTSNPTRRPTAAGEDISDFIPIESNNQLTNAEERLFEVNQQNPYDNISSSDTTDCAHIKCNQTNTQLPRIRFPTKSTASDASTEDLSESDQKINVKFYSECILCHKKNKHSEYKYCQNCWKKICSSRPVRKIKKKKRLHNKLKDRKTSEAQKCVQLDQDIELSRPSTSNSSNNCLFCCINENNAAFIHGQSAHRCCCYTCGKKAWKKKRLCPICNRVINNVVKIFDP